MNNSLFVDKYQPLYFHQFEVNSQVISILETLIKMDNLSVLFVGGIGSGKTSFLKAIIREYYKNYTPIEYDNNILYINSLSLKKNFF